MGLHHPNIVKNYGWSDRGILTSDDKVFEGKFFAELESCNRGDMFDLITQHKGFSEEVTRGYAL
jgi:serine/threonine protein kinase